MTYAITVLTDTAEIQRRGKQIDPIGYSTIAQIFHANLLGLEEQTNARVLEIGGAQYENFALYFQKRGAQYHNVTLDRECQNMPNTTIESYTNTNCSPEPFDLILSNGVFEQCALDRSLSMGRLEYQTWMAGIKYRTPQYNLQKLQKLYQLTKPQGRIIINTIADPCIFSSDEIRTAGFHIAYRGIKNIYNPDSRYSEGELLLLQKP